MPRVKQSEKKTTAAKSAKKSRLTVDVVDLKGKVVGTTSLPKEIFGVVVSDALLAQAVHVYRTNKRQGTVATKTRGEVAYSTHKIYRQKGTGRARHGSKRAPIFVGGGITFGPQPRDFDLKLTQKQRRKALYGVLSQKVASHDCIVVSNIEKVGQKTKQVAQMLERLAIADKPTLIVTAVGENSDVVRAARNIPTVTIQPVGQLNAYAVLAHHKLVVAQKALEYFVQKRETR